MLVYNYFIYIHLIYLTLLPARLLKFGALALCCRGTKSAGGGGGSI